MDSTKVKKAYALLQRLENTQRWYSQVSKREAQLWVESSTYGPSFPVAAHIIREYLLDQITLIKGELAALGVQA